MVQPKKEIEGHYFDRFKTLLQPFLEGAVYATEEPDFLVTASDKIVGVELTELHREEPQRRVPQQASEAMRHRVVARAQEIYISQGNPPVRCTVFLNEKHIQKAEVEALAIAIVNIALRNLPHPNSSGREYFNWTNRFYFPEIVQSLAIHRLDVITESHFSCPGATWVAPLSVADIGRAVDSKEEKYSAYRRRCDEVWLLINIDIGPMSTWFCFDSSMVESPVSTSFERVFVLRHFGSKLYELAVISKNGG